MHDWDATEVPILADLTIAGQPRKVVMFANRNGFYYTLDRTNGKVIVAKPFVHDDVGEGDRTRRPADAAAGPHAGREGRDHLSRTSPAAPTSGRRPSIRRTRTFFVNAREACMTFYAWKPDYKAGERFTGGAGQRVHERDDARVRRAARDRSGDRRAEVGVQVPDARRRRAC